jgi:ferredoxin
LFSIEMLSEPPTADQLASFDLLLFGAPVYAYNAPRFFVDFLKRLPDGQGKRTSLFLAPGGDGKAALDLPTAILRRKGYDVIRSEYFDMPGNMIVRRFDRESGDIDFSLLGWKYRQNAHEVVAECRVRIQEAVRGLLADEVGLQTTTFGARMTTSLLRPVFFHLACPSFHWVLHASRDCTLCGICMRACPTRNIRIQKKKVRFGTKCTVCFRCINICPEHAVRLRWPLGFADNTAQYVMPGWKVPQMTDSRPGANERE